MLLALIATIAFLRWENIFLDNPDQCFCYSGAPTVQSIALPFSQKSHVCEKKVQKTIQTHSQTNAFTDTAIPSASPITSHGFHQNVALGRRPQRSTPQISVFKVAWTLDTYDKHPLET